MTKKIEFISPTQEVWDKLPTPQPAKKYIADWYKNSDNFIGGKKEYGENGLNKDIRLCAPFLDIMLNGYILELSCDVVVEKDINGRTFAWTQNPPPIIPRNPEMAKTLPRPAGHDNEMYAWNMSHGILTPPGYSSIITHPFNRFDLPFTTTSGVIESDQYSMPGEIPFFFKKGFEGVISAGTPIAQVLPFKRDSWKSEKAKFNSKFNIGQLYSIRRNFYGAYKKLYWVKKTFK